MTMIDVKDYGATGDGSTDDTSAIEAAITALLGLQASSGMSAWVASTAYTVGQRRTNAGNIYEVITMGTSAGSGGPTTTMSDITDGSVHWKYIAGGGSLTSYTVPTLFFPTGRYKVSNTIALPSFILGEQSIVFPADVADFSIFQPPQSGMCSIRGMTVRGGLNGIFVQGNGVTDLVLHISECEFMDQTNAAIATSEDSNASSVFVSSCHFYMTAGGGCILDALTGDRIVIRDSWLACALGDVFRLGNSEADGPAVEILDCAGGPGAGTHTGPWVDLKKGTVVCRNCRFGGEADKVILTCYGGYDSAVTIEDCAVYSGSLNNFEFHALPRYTRIVRNIGNGKGLSLESGIPDADKRRIGNTSYFEFDGLLGSARNDFTFHDFNVLDVDEEALYAIIGNTPGYREGFVPTNALLDVFLPRDTTAPGYSNAATDVSGPDGTGLSGETTQVLTATANGASYTVSFGEAMTDPETGAARATGVYTVVFDLDVSVHPVKVVMYGGDRQDIRTLEPGRHLAHLHFGYGGGFSTLSQIGLSLGFVDDGVVAVGRMRLFAGRVRVNTLYTELFGTAVPSTGQRFLRGDVVKNSQPSSGGFERWVCAVNGYRAAAWVALTAYVQYQRRKNGSNVYEVVTGGTSGNTGGPTGTSPGADGGVTWRYIGPVATFYGAAAVDTTPV